MKKLIYYLTVTLLLTIVISTFSSCSRLGYYSEEDLEKAYNNGYENGKEAGLDLYVARAEAEFKSMSPSDFSDLCHSFTGEYLIDGEELSEYSREISHICFSLGYAAALLGYEDYYGVRYIDYYPEIGNYLDDYPIQDLEEYSLTH